MIQNILTFCVKNDLSFVDGSIPSGKLVANDINRNSIYLITPYANAIIYANFQTNLQSDKPTSVLGILVNGDITVSEIIEPSKSYYSLVKDWNIYEFKVPSTTLAFISRNRTGKIGINFSIEQRLVPPIKPTYGTYRGEIVVLEQEPTLDGYYIVKALDYSFEDSVEIKTFDLNDILVFNANTNVATKYSAYSNKGSTPTAMYSVDPSLLNDNFETIQPSLTSQIVGQVNENTSDILLILQAIGVSDSTLLDFSNRISVAEQDIDDLETNSVYTITEVDTTTIDIDVDRATHNGYEITANLIIDPIKNDLIKNDGNGVYVRDNDIADSVKNSINTNNQLLKDEVKAVVNEVGTTNTWQTLNDINTNINNKVSTHDQSATAHLSLRTLIADLQKEIDRLNAKGRSWGEIDKTYSELVAMGEPTMSEYISDYLAVAFGHTPTEIGDLIYTKVSDTEPEYEMEFNGSLWVSNGAYLVSKASNTQMGLVQGDLTYVSVLNGLIQVLKSDYATNVGTTGASYDYATLLGNFTNVMNELADRYEKSETYSNAQIEQRLTDLLGLANLQDTAIEKSAGVFVFDNGDSLLASSLAQYNWVICRFYNVDGGVQNVRYNMFKPSEATSGNRTIVQIDRNPVRYAEIKRDNGNILFRVVDESDTFDNTYVCTMKMWGIKLDGITASEISYDGTISGLSSTNVKTAIDELASEKADIDYLLDKSTNLINYENMVLGYWVNQTNGLLEVGASYRTSDYIKVIGGEKYTIYSVYRYAFYNENKVYISGSTTALSTVPNTLTAPANAVYLRFSTDIALATLPLKYYQVNKGDTLLAFEPYWVRIKPKFIKVLEDGTIGFNETNFVKLGKNLFDYTTSTNGYYINQANGEAGVSASYYVSAVIDIEGNENYYISGAETLRICFYDINGKFISGIYNDTMPILSPATAKSLRFSAYISVGKPKSLAQLEKGSVISAFEPYGYQFTKSNKLADTIEEPLIVLPPKLYAIAGKELNIYYDNILNFDYKKYDFDVVCAVGEQWQRRFKYVPSANGTFPITVKVLEKNIEKSVATSSIIVKAPTVGNGITKKVIIIGDSTTANGTTITKLNENFATDVMTLQTLGTKGTSPNNHEGISGWTIGMFKSTESNAYGTNAFFNPSTSLFDFTYYMANSGVDVPDYVVINLGINDTFGLTSDSQVATAINQLKLDYQFVIDSILAYSPSIKIGVAITIPPNYSQDAFGKAYKSVQTRWRYKRNNFLWTKELINYFKNKEAQNIYLIPINTNLDTEYNMGFESEQINARNATMINVPVGNGGVHPDTSGYHQIADVYWYWLKSFES